jgi:hypothetical protein
LSSSSGAPTGLSDVRWTRTTVGGPNYLGGSVTSATSWTPMEVAEFIAFFIYFLRRHACFLPERCGSTKGLFGWAMAVKKVAVSYGKSCCRL